MKDNNFDFNFGSNNSANRRYTVDFIMGAIPVPMLHKIAECGTNALRAMIPILHNYGFAANRGKKMKLYRDRGCEMAGCDWDTLVKGLEELEKAELVSLRKLGEYKYEVLMIENEHWFE